MTWHEAGGSRKPDRGPVPPPEDGESQGVIARLNLDINPPVFLIAAALILLFVALTILDRAHVGDLFAAIQHFIASAAGWFYILCVNLVLGFVIYLMFSRFGSVRLGGRNAKPEFSLFGWFAMLFSAGMGIGLLFYSVAEPMMHFADAPLAESRSVEAARQAMGITFLHWGLHPWAVYALVGLSLAFSSFNMRLPLTISSVFHPLIGERIYGPVGHAIDIAVTVATLFGVATSLGLGVQQVNAGLHHVFGLPQDQWVQVALVAVITAFATISVVKGLDGGIRRVSELNFYFAGALLMFVFIVGPTLFILKAVVQNVGYYLQNFFFLSTWTETYTRTHWQEEWTVFYWGWWIAWSPFVGMFIARISRGRTVREFLVGVLLVPTLLTFLWLTIFGDTALLLELSGQGDLAEAVSENLPVALFVLLEHFPLSLVTNILAIIVVVTFFVTSSDSGSLVIDIVTSGGSPEPPVIQRLFWAILEGVVAAALLLGGGLLALQTAAIATGLPLSIILLFMAYSLLRGLAQYVDTRYPDISALQQILANKRITDHLMTMTHESPDEQKKRRNL